MLDVVKEILILYFYYLMCFAVMAFEYWCFHGALEARLVRLRKINRVKLEELKKGLKNYWFLEALHKKVNLGLWYKVNKIFVIWYWILLVIFLPGGGFENVRRFVSAASLPLYVLCIPMMILYNIEHNYYCYKKPFVWFAISNKIKRGAIDSIFFDLLGYGFIIMLAFTHVKLYLGI